MIYTPHTKKAMQLCFEAHKEQKDKAGLPYVFHPFHVAEQMPDEETTIVALLHDVIEDTSYTLQDLRAMGFDGDVIDALALMTHEKGVPYLDYAAKLRDNEIARTVKLADLRHNSDLTRLDEIGGEALERIETYQAAIKLLSEAESSYKPYYDRGAAVWRVDFPDRDSEEGDLLYVAGEYARTGLFFPYHDAGTANSEYCAHAHSFDGVLGALLDEPEGFTIAGFEAYYSKQEQEMLLALQAKLLSGGTAQACPKANKPFQEAPVPEINVTLTPLAEEDREQFIRDNQIAFKYGAVEEFGLRDDHFEEDGEIISRETIERSIDGGEAYRIRLDGNIAGGLVVQIDPETRHNHLDLLFVDPAVHSRGIGQAAWRALEKLYPETRVWETCTPYFEKRNIHFYVNRCGFHIVEFFCAAHRDPHETAFDGEGPADEGPDEMFRFEKEMK